MSTIKSMGTLQCRGPEGKLARDVGVVIITEEVHHDQRRDDKIIVRCPRVYEGGRVQYCSTNKRPCPLTYSNFPK